MLGKTTKTAILALACSAACFSSCTNVPKATDGDRVPFERTGQEALTQNAAACIEYINSKRNSDIALNSTSLALGAISIIVGAANNGSIGDPNSEAQARTFNWIAVGAAAVSFIAQGSRAFVDVQGATNAFSSLSLAKAQATAEQYEEANNHLERCRTGRGPESVADHAPEVGRSKYSILNARGANPYSKAR